MDSPTFGPTAERTIRPSTDYSDRDGYGPDFIPGYEVPLPSHCDMSRIAARNAEALSGTKIYELQYHHCHASHAKARPVRCLQHRRSKAEEFDRDTGDVSASQRKRSSLSLNSSRIGAPSTRCQPDNLSRTVAFYYCTFRFCMGGHGFIWGRPQRGLH